MNGQRYRFRNPASGQDVVIVAEPGRVYHDVETGEELEPVGVILPLSPSESSLPWAVENLRHCNHCGQMTQKDLNVCPTCSRRLGPVAA